MPRTDILFNNKDELLIEETSNGPDIAIGTEGTDERIVLDILTAHPGEYSEYPLLGLSVSNYLQASGDAATNRLTRDAKRQLKQDGYNLISLDLQGDIDFEEL